jgi:hypothetical protein
MQKLSVLYYPGDRERERSLLSMKKARFEVEREGLLAMCSKYFIPVINQLLEEVAKGLEICAVVIIIPQQSVGACSKAFQTTSELVLFY